MKISEEYLKAAPRPRRGKWRLRRGCALEFGGQRFSSRAGVSWLTRTIRSIESLIFALFRFVPLVLPSARFVSPRFAWAGNFSDEPRPCAAALFRISLALLDLPAAIRPPTRDGASLLLGAHFNASLIFDLISVKMIQNPFPSPPASHLLLVLLRSIVLPSASGSYSAGQVPPLYLLYLFSFPFTFRACRSSLVLAVGFRRKGPLSLTKFAE